MAKRLFRLTVDDLTARGRFNLRLTDGRGKHLASREVHADPGDARWRGLFEMDQYLEVQRGRGLTDRELLAELGDFIGQELLGPQITAELFQSQRSGILFVVLPRERRPEVLELTRVPWELARDERGERGRTLPDVGLAVQILPQGAMPEGASLDRALAAARPFEPSPGPLRVLMAFAQTRWQTVLAMREMRERLRRFFLEKLAPRYRVELDILQYGVTREELRRAARRGGGYHIVHLFAHGHEDLLVLEDEQGRDDLVSGDEVAGLLSGDFANPPYLVFLTACHSGELRLRRELTDLWQALRQVQQAAARTEMAPDASALTGALEEALGVYTGTAFAMLRAEVPQVVAMRYAVEERFAFDLAEDFYRYVLLEGVPPALALGRFRAEARREGDQRGYRPHDWATPAFFGGPEGSQPIVLPRGRSEAADRLWVRGRLPDELRRVERFVGRTDELRRLRRGLFSRQPEQAVALLWGVGGLGKTALAAEAVHLWHADFDFVFGARPPAADRSLSLDAWLQEVDYHVLHSLGVSDYRIWDEQGDLPRDRWLESRLSELLRFLNRYRMLLVIDNFEPNLRRAGEAEAVRYVCADPDWGTALARLAGDLTPGLSCLLVTSRRAPAELRRPQVLSLPVGPLKRGEWWVFARTAPNFRRLLRGSDKERALLARALAVARGHPLILNALERLAEVPAELAHRLAEFEARGERYAGMGDLLATGRTAGERAREMAYFEDIAATSVRALIEDRSPAAQRLLRVITLALEPVYDGLIEAIWEDERWPDDMPRLQPQGQGWREPLEELLASGLLTREQKMMTSTAGESHEVVTYVWHPIVAEQAEPCEGLEPSQGLQGFPAAGYLRRYARYNISTFLHYREAAQSRAQAQLALNAARDAVRYLLRLGDTARAVALITEIHDLSQALGFRRDLQSWIRELLDQVPPGQDRERLLRSLADVYWRGGRPEAAIPLYRRALESAEARQDWLSCGIISHQLGNALGAAADYPAARAAYRAALRYGRLRGKTITGRLPELGELVRLLVIEGGERNLARARAHAARQARIARAYYDRCRADPAAAEEGATAAPEDLLIPALDIQCMVEHAAKNWPAALRLCEEQIELERRHHKGDLAVALDRGNRAVALKNLDRLDEAERDLHFCLRVFHQHQQPVYEAKVLSELAAVADRRGDPARAAQFQTQALEIRHRLGALSDAAISHNNLAIYYGKQGRHIEMIREDCCAILISDHIGKLQLLQGTINNLHLHLSEVSLSERRAHWPTAAALFAAYPRLAEQLARRGVATQQAQATLDQLWERAT